MQLWEIFTRLDEMAYTRKAITDKLRALQGPIILHAVKILVYPNSQDVPHWKHELAAWGNDLAFMQLRVMRHARPMGFKLSWRGLYQEPLEGHETVSLQFLLDRLRKEYQEPITQSVDQIRPQLIEFLRALAQAIGAGHLVNSIVDELGKAVKT